MIIEVVGVMSFLLLYQLVNPVKLVKMPDKLVDFVSIHKQRGGINDIQDNFKKSYNACGVASV